MVVSIWLSGEKTQHEVVNHREKYPSPNLRSSGQKREAKVQKSNTCQVGCFSWITTATNSKTVRVKTGPEEVLLGGMGFVF